MQKGLSSQTQRYTQSFILRISAKSCEIILFTLVLNENLHFAQVSIYNYFYRGHISAFCHREFYEEEQDSP